MAVAFRHRGRTLSGAEIAFVRELIGANPGASRRQLSKILCEAWNWVQPNGELRDGVCRSMMLGLHRAGEIELPPVRCRPPNNAIRRRRPRRVACDQSPIEAELSEVRPLDIRLVRRTEDEPLFDGLLSEHHYLGYQRPVGAHLKYLVRAGTRPVACFLWSSAARWLRPRDRFIGWPPGARLANIRYVAYNPRFLILPWVRVPNLASHLLSRMARRLSLDWEAAYGHPIFYLETFVDPARYRGTCYRAANWVVLGLTTGRGNNAPTCEQRVPIKEVLGYPLVRDFRERLSEGG